MARFDQGLTYDSGTRYDEPAPPTPSTNKRKAMSKPKLELKKRTDTDLITFIQGILTAMTGNANFPTPMPALAAVTAALTDFQARIATITELQNQLRQAHTDKDTSRDTLEQLVTYLGNYVEIAAAGSDSKIESAGMPVRSPNTPVGLPAAPLNLNATASTYPGAIDLTWDPVPGAATYEIQCKVHGDASPFTNAKSSTSSRTTIEGLTPGTQYAFQVRALGTADPSPYSDEAVKRAP
jgi:hypothetical protein